MFKLVYFDESISFMFSKLQFLPKIIQLTSINSSFTDLFIHITFHHTFFCELLHLFKNVTPVLIE